MLTVVQPRKQFVQVSKVKFTDVYGLTNGLKPNTFLVNDEVVLKEYPLTAEGLIESFIEKKL